MLHGFAGHTAGEALRHLRLRAVDGLQGSGLSGHLCGVEGPHGVDEAPAEEESVNHVEEGAQTDEGVVGAQRLRADVGGVVAELLDEVYVALKLPVAVDEGVHRGAP